MFILSENCPLRGSRVVSTFPVDILMEPATDGVVEFDLEQNNR